MTISSLCGLSGDADPLTGLQGQYVFLNLLTALAQEKKHCEIMILGIDNFKTINSLYTYSFGDEVLRYFAEELQSILPPSAQLFRLDGDSFGVVYIGNAPSQCEEMYGKISLRPRKIDVRSVLFTVSAGICLYPQHGDDGNALFANVCLALAQAKKGTKKCLCYYSSDMSERIKRDMLILERLRESVAHGFTGFHLHYQPIMWNDTKKLHGCEALLRWNDEVFPDGVSPYEFIPLLECSGLIWEVGRWVITNAFAQCAAWQMLVPDFCMNINMSARQLDDHLFPEFVVHTLKQNKVPPRTIILELTESTNCAFDTIHKSFDYLRKEGIQIALDDFGTGYATLDVFRQVNADKLKIDRSFLERITDNVTDQVLLKSLIAMCRAMNINVCVEGVESRDVEHIVTQMNPDLVQGYLYSRPLSYEQFEAQYLQDNELQRNPKEIQSPVVYSEYRPAKPISFSEIINNAHAGILHVAMDNDFTLLTCNEGYRRLLGYTAREMEEIFGNKALGLVHPEDRVSVNEEIRRQLGQGDTVTIEFRVVRADGRPLWVLGTGNVVRDSRGNSTLIVNIIDNDKRKCECLKNQVQMAQYERILALLPTGIKYIRYDADFTIDYISPGFLSIMGFTHQEVFEQFEGKYINFIYEEDRQQVYRDALNQFQSSDVILLRYRSICKDGRLLWMETLTRLCDIEPDGVRHCCSSVVNITETITTEEKSPSFNIMNRLHKAARLWGEVMFDYNFITKKFVMSESFTHLFGYELPESGIVDPELIFHSGALQLHTLLEQAHAGKQLAPIELHATRADGHMLWCRVLVHPSDNIGDARVSTIGKIINIDEEREERECLRQASQTDSLTRLYNKGSIEAHMTAALEKMPENAYTCWILDLDNFKNVNDTFGHMVGDKLLQSIAERLYTAFRKTDIIGRIGGDEFLIFAAYNGDSESLCKRAQRVLDLLREPLALDGSLVHPTVSIGIACYPTDGTTFSELYQNADKALYRIKTLNKNDFCVYNL